MRRRVRAREMHKPAPVKEMRRLVRIKETRRLVRVVEQMREQTMAARVGLHRVPGRAGTSMAAAMWTEDTDSKVADKQNAAPATRPSTGNNATRPATGNNGSTKPANNNQGNSSSIAACKPSTTAAVQT